MRGHEHNAIAQEHRFDLVLTDMLMADVSGPELVDQISQSNPDARVLYMTGYAPAELCGRYGISESCVLQKPFTAEELLSGLEEALGD